MNNVELSKLQHEAGTGHWKAFRALDMDVEFVFSAAKDWKRQLKGVDKGWLCWNVDPDWCLIQQRLVESVGWTPVVGFDPRVALRRPLTTPYSSISTRRLACRSCIPIFRWSSCFSLPPD